MLHFTVSAYRATRQSSPQPERAALWRRVWRVLVPSLEPSGWPSARRSIALASDAAPLWIADQHGATRQGVSRQGWDRPYGVEGGRPPIRANYPPLPRFRREEVFWKLVHNRFPCYSGHASLLDYPGIPPDPSKSFLGQGKSAGALLIGSPGQSWVSGLYSCRGLKKVLHSPVIGAKSGRWCNINRKVTMKPLAIILPFGRSRLVWSGNLSNVVVRTSGCAAVGLLCLLSAFRAWSADCVAPPAGLVAWWPGEGNADDMAGTNNGTPLNGASFAPGEVGSAFSFNGSNQCVQIPYSQTLVDANYSVEVWVNPLAQVSGPLNQDVIFGQSFGQCLLLARTGSSGVAIAFGFGTSQVTFKLVVSASELPIGQFSHLVGTWDGTTLRLYVNGVLDAQSTPGASPVDSGCSFFIGGLYTANEGSCNYEGQFFNGLIDEVSFFNRALSGAEIQSIYNAGSAGKCIVPFITSQPRGQVGYWGKSVTFTVTSAGTTPLSYQWLKNATPVQGASGSSLVLTNLQLTDAGNYSVVVTNAYGSTTSSNAYLTMNPAGVSLALYSGITIDGVVGLTYGVQYSTDLSNTNSWRGMANVTLGVPTELWFDTQPANQPQRYYRVVPGPISVP